MRFRALTLPAWTIESDPAPAQSTGRGWRGAALACSILACFSAAGLIVLKDHLRLEWALAWIAGSILIAAWLVDTRGPGAASTIGWATVPTQPRERALILGLDPRRQVSIVVVSGSAIVAALALTKAAGDGHTAVGALITSVLSIGSAILFGLAVLRARGHGLGVALTRSGVAVRSVMSDLFVAWEAISTLELRGTDVGMKFLTVTLRSPDAVLMGGLRGRLPRNVAGRETPQIGVIPSGLSADPDVLALLLVEALESLELRGVIGSPLGLSRLRQLERVQPPVIRGDLQWTARQAVRLLITGGLAVAGGIVFIQVARRLWFADGPLPAGGAVLILLGAATIAPLLEMPYGRSEFLTKLGCRRAAIWWVLATTWWVLCVGVFAGLAAAGLVE